MPNLYLIRWTHIVKAIKRKNNLIHYLSRQERERVRPKRKRKKRKKKRTRREPRKTIRNSPKRKNSRKSKAMMTIITVLLRLSDSICKSKIGRITY